MNCFFLVFKDSKRIGRNYTWPPSKLQCWTQRWQLIRVGVHHSRSSRLCLWRRCIFPRYTFLSGVSFQTTKGMSASASNKRHRLTYCCFVVCTVFLNMGYLIPLTLRITEKGDGILISCFPLRITYADCIPHTYHTDISGRSINKNDEVLPLSFLFICIRFLIFSFLHFYSHSLHLYVHFHF